MSAFNSTPFNSSLFGGGSAPLCNMKCRDVLYIAFREARILKRPQGLSSGSELADGLLFLNQQIDYWSARGCYSWTTTFQTFTLTPNHQPYLIGPNLTAPDFAAPQRPVKIVSANVILPGNATTDIPIMIRDNAWWAAKSTKNQTSTFPTDLYYEPDVPNGQLWFWPIATVGYGVRLEGMVFLQQFQTLDDCFIAPPAYLAAATLTLAEELVDLWGTEMPLNLARRAMKARDALQSNNNLPPRIDSADWGTYSRARADFNYVTGTIPNK
jgi:hypothetical protein